MHKATPQHQQPPLTYDRHLISQVKAGKGSAAKLLRDQLESNPSLTAKFLKERKTEMENHKEKEKMMWTKDANSRVHRVENAYRDRVTFTNPMNTYCVPDRYTVYNAQYRLEQEKKQTPVGIQIGGGGVSLFN